MPPVCQTSQRLASYGPYGSKRKTKLCDVRNPKMIYMSWLLFLVMDGIIYPFSQNLLGFHWIKLTFFSQVITSNPEQLKITHPHLQLQGISPRQPICVCNFIIDLTNPAHHWKYRLVYCLSVGLYNL